MEDKSDVFYDYSVHEGSSGHFLKTNRTPQVSTSNFISNLVYFHT